jgi:hypothetical protein
MGAPFPSSPEKERIKPRGWASAGKDQPSNIMKTKNVTPPILLFFDENGKVEGVVLVIRRPCLSTLMDSMR